MNGATLREHATALCETARVLALVLIADLGCKVAAWAEARDLDSEWKENNPDAVK